jgi:hypothetical protein
VRIPFPAPDQPVYVRSFETLLISKCAYILSHELQKVHPGKNKDHREISVVSLFMFLGLKLAGVAGMIILPIVLIIVITFYKRQITAADK